MWILNVVSGQNPRQIAAQVLRQRRVGGGFIEDLMEQALANTQLSALDRGLCQELVYGVVRWQATLDWLIARKTDGRVQKPALHDLLQFGLYQIFWLDRIPGHAAVNETVELAKQNGYGSQAGFVNAVLRGFLREAEPTKKLLAELKLSNPAAGFSHPQWLIDKWRKHFGDEPTRQLLEWNNTPPKTFARVNALAWERRCPAGENAGADPAAVVRPILNTGDLLVRWREENVEYDFVRRDWLEENLVFELKSHPPLTSLESFRQGWFYLQDPGTLLAPVWLGAQPGETVLDFCAAPGGKTTFLAQLMHNGGRIVAQDVSGERLKLIEENCRRLGVTCVELYQNRPDEAQTSNPGRDQESLAPSPANREFDKVLVDAPCSNTGVMRRRVDLRWRIRPEEISRLQRTQLSLLQQAATRLKPGGVLVYSTCSLEPEENGGVVKSFLAGHANFKLVDERELRPFADGVDGAYVARLKRV
jgi:16S rRNA (cytosine967-C5)-methyltransferase